MTIRISMFSGAVSISAPTNKDPPNSHSAAIRYKLARKIDSLGRAVHDVRMMEKEPLPPPEESPFWRSLGITPTFEDEASAPPVDVEKLRRYYRTAVAKTNELDEAGCKDVQKLMGKFRSWYVAFGEVVRARGRSEN